MTRMNRIKRKLDVLKPHYCKVFNESYMHEGHVDNSIESHFRIKISNNIFTNENLLIKHRMINELLKDEFENGLHALSIEIV